MKYLVIVQARMGSTRLPGKVLKKIGEKTALELLLERVSLSHKLDDIVVATTINKEDLAIVRKVSELGYSVFIGSENDVLDRYYQAARLYKPEYVIRLTADNPLLDWRVLDDGIDMLQRETEYLGMLSETFPEGEIIEIVRFDALEFMWINAKLSSEREHVTLYIKNHRNDFKVQDYLCKLGNLYDERWTMDCEDDLELIRKVYDYFSPRIDFSLEEIYEFLRQYPDIRNINRKHKRNEGLYISLKKDKIVKAIGGLL